MQKEIISPDDSMFGGENPEKLVTKSWALRTLKRQQGCEFEGMLLEVCGKDDVKMTLRDFLTWHRRLKVWNNRRGPARGCDCCRGNAKAHFSGSLWEAFGGVWVTW